MGYYKISIKSDFEQAQVAWLQSHREMCPNDLITSKYCELLQVGEFWYIPATEVTEQWGIGELVGDIHEWHFGLDVQVILTYEDNLKLLSEVPELAVYVRNNDIPTIIENGYIYIYANFLLEEHREILEQFNAVINERSI